MMNHMENYFNMIADLRNNKDLRNFLPKVAEKEELKKPPSIITVSSGESAPTQSK